MYAGRSADNPIGAVHGGLVCTLLDDASGAVVAIATSTLVVSDLPRRAAGDLEGPRKPE